MFRPKLGVCCFCLKKLCCEANIWMNSHDSIILYLVSVSIIFVTFSAWHKFNCLSWCVSCFTWLLSGCCHCDSRSAMCDLFSHKHHDGTCTQMLQNKRMQIERNRALTATTEAGALLLNCKVNSCIYRPVLYCIVILVMMPMCDRICLTCIVY